jgi:hypothetical protein
MFSKNNYFYFIFKKKIYTAKKAKSNVGSILLVEGIQGQESN